MFVDKSEVVYIMVPGEDYQNKGGEYDQSYYAALLEVLDYWVVSWGIRYGDKNKDRFQCASHGSCSPPTALHEYYPYVIRNTNVQPY